MITIPSSNGLYSITLQGDKRPPYDANLFSLSKSMLRVKRTSPSISIAHVELTDGGVTAVNDYYTDTEGAVEFPLRNFVNATIARGSSLFTLLVILKDLDGTVVDGAINVGCYVHEGISYSDRRVPIHPFLGNPIPNDLPFGIVLPPVVMYMQQFGGTDAPDQLLSGVVAETHGLGAFWSWGAAGVFTPISTSGERYNQLIVNSAAEILRWENLKLGIQRDWIFRRIDYAECVDAVVVRWQSLTGAVRQHWFPVVGYDNDTDKSLSLLSVGDGYNVRKNPTLALRCRLSGLSAYDCWYYQDMLQASNVHAICLSQWYNMPPFLTAIQSTLTECYVEGGMPQTPEGNGFNNFEFTIKMKHYDAI